MEGNIYAIDSEIAEQYVGSDLKGSLAKFSYSCVGSSQDHSFEQGEKVDGIFIRTLFAERNWCQMYYEFTTASI